MVKRRKDDDDINLEEGLNYDAQNAPYGHENTDSD